MDLHQHTREKPTFPSLDVEVKRRMLPEWIKENQPYVINVYWYITDATISLIPRLFDSESVPYLCRYYIVASV
jgi:hypothetical protein